MADKVYFDPLRWPWHGASEIFQRLNNAHVMHLFSAARNAGMKFRSGTATKAQLIERLMDSSMIARATVSGIQRLEAGEGMQGGSGEAQGSGKATGGLMDDLEAEDGTSGADEGEAQGSGSEGPPRASHNAETCTEAPAIRKLEVAMREAAIMLGSHTTDIRTIKAAMQRGHDNLQDVDKRLSALETRKPVVFTIGEAVSTLPVENHHAMFPEMVQWLEMHKHVMLIGPAGSGKSTAAESFAKLKGLTLYSIPQATDSFGVLGFVGPNGIVSTPFAEAWQKGGVCLIDEISMFGPDAIGSLNAALAGDYGKARAPLPGVGYTPMHPDFYCIAGDNSDQGATTKYSARQLLDGATMDRFIILDWPYDPEVEKALAGPWQDWRVAVQAIREFIDKNDIQHVGATPRAIRSGADALTRCKGISRKRVLEATMKRGALRADWIRVEALPQVQAFLRGA